MSETSTPSTQNTATQLKSRYDDLKNRGTQVALAIQAAIPVKDRTPAAQEAFLFVVSDLKVIEPLIEMAQGTLNAIALDEADPEQIEQAGGLAKILAELTQQLEEALEEQFGVSKAVVMPTVYKDLGRQLDLIEVLVKRAEADLATFNA
jgi:hypothetical protein